MNNWAGIVTQPPIHRLAHPWTLWYIYRKQGQKYGGDTDYEKALKNIGTFDTVEQFWGLYSAIPKPHELPFISDLHIFKNGINPTWEDPFNQHGGKWIIRLKKGVSSRLWEVLTLLLIGDQFENTNEITGIVLSIRHHEDILSIWTGDAQSENRERIKQQVQKFFGLEGALYMEYKAHQLPINVIESRGDHQLIA